MMMDDAGLLQLWLAGRPPATQAAYRRTLRRVAQGGPLGAAGLAQLQAYVATRQQLAPRSLALEIAAIKSFYQFHHILMTLPHDPATSLRAPTIPGDLAERILPQADVQRLIAAASGADRVMLRVLYLGGLRASELCSLRWRNLAPRDNGEGQATIVGKGGKTRTVLLTTSVWGDLQALEPDDAAPGAPVFPSANDRKKAIGARQLLSIVKRAAKSAGLSDRVSSHWLRHANASHSLDAGCPIHVVQQTLGHSSLATTSRYCHARPDAGSARFLE